MNEITKVHLGRQPFVIAVDAHKLLQDYLLEIKHQVGKGGDGVVDEVEMRIAELLAERGIKGEKVILASDVEYVKEQLGSPTDFKDDETDEPDAGAADDTANQAADQPARRLFRDTEHGMVAGVAAGIAAYFNIDPVIVRILFVIAMLSGGWGLLVYLVLWIVVPEAKTASERLQMRGKAVTVDSLKEIVDRADVTGAATRASRSLVTITSTIAKLVLALAGGVLATFALGMLAAAAIAGLYMVLHDGHFLHGAMTFPVGHTETLAAIGGLGVLVGVSAFLLATGVSMVRRKWSVPGWGVAALAALLIVSVVVSGAAVPDTVQSVRARYEANSHTTTRTLQAFHKVRIINGAAIVPIGYDSDNTGMEQPAMTADGAAAAKAKADTDTSSAADTSASPDTYRVTLRYVGDVDVRAIKTTVQDDTLIIDTRNFKPGANWDCDGMCIGQKDYFTLTVHTPQPLSDDWQVWQQ